MGYSVKQIHQLGFGIMNRSGNFAPMADVSLTDVHGSAAYTRRDILVIASPSAVVFDFVMRESNAVVESGPFTDFTKYNRVTVRGERNDERNGHS